MRFCCTPRRLQLFALFVAAVTIITILIILFIFNYPTFARQRVIDTVVFKNGTVEMDRFKTTADLVNLRLTIYVYNVTNADEVVRSSAKIHVQQLGPFVYHEYKTKEFLDNNQTSGLITYKLRKQYTFLPKESIGNPTKLKIVWPNVPLLAAKGYLDLLPFYERIPAYIIFNQAIKSYNETAFITDTIDNFIFTGSKRKLFEYLQNLDIFQMFKPWPLPNNKFAVLYDRNNTWYPWRDHVFTISAGHGINQTYRNLNQYVAMNGSSTLPYWLPNPPNCNKLKGTDGEFFSPFLNSSENLMVYSVDICRKLELKYRLNTTISGIKVNKYTLDERSFLSGTKNLENQCYCLGRNSSRSTSSECQLDGLTDLSNCVAKNVFASGAHFLYGSPELLTRVSGVDPPNATIDEPLVYIEPNTGLTIQVKVPLQLNIRLEKSRFNIFNFFEEDKPLIIPLLYVIEAAEMTDEQASLLRSKLLLLDSWFVSMVLGGSIVFILAIIAAGIVICMKYRNLRHPVPTTTTPSETDPLIGRRRASPERVIS